MSYETPFEKQRLACLALHLRGATHLKYFRLMDLNPSVDFIQIGYFLYGNEFDDSLEKSLSIYNRHEQNNIGLLTPLDNRYPELLRKSINPPLAIFFLGQVELLSLKSISIVGTRKPSLITLPWLASICDYLAKNKFVLVSGLATGVDSTVHFQGLQYGTVAVLPQSLDLKYPRIHCNLFKQAEQKDRILLLSEYPVSTSARKFHFVHRNRIISALSNWTIFAEGGHKSGALITAKWCIKNQRRLFVLSHALQFNNAGVHDLLKTNDAIDISEFFPLEVQNSEFHTKFKDPNFVYLGNNSWVKVKKDYFSLKFLSPGLLDPGFEPYTG